MQLRRISSLWTVFQKFILPLIFLLGLLNVLLFGTRNFSPDNALPDFVIYLMPVAFGIIALWQAWSLKWVAVDYQNKRLYVSNYRKEISIPFSEIADVTEFMLSDPRRIKIHLRTKTEFGQKIVFLGTYRFGGWLAGPHPIVNELLLLSNEI